MAHKVQAGSFADKRRGSRHERGYGTAWDKMRTETLREQAGLCQPCLRNGLVTPNCRIVDHIVPKAQGGTDAPTNRQVICKPCHDAKTATEARHARGLGPADPTTLATEASKPSEGGAHPCGAPALEDRPAGGGEKSGARHLRTDLQGSFSRAGYSTGGGIPGGDGSQV